MSEQGFTLFSTPIGTCGIAWSDYGIAGLQLPERSERALRAKMKRRFPEASEGDAPPAAQGSIDAILGLMRGEASALADVQLDLEGVPPFHRLVYEAARAIPPGATLSYGELAARAGSPGAARAVGQALRKNPFAIVVPCHRVLAAGGKVGGFTASGGVSTKLKLLALERAEERATAAPAAAAEVMPSAESGFDYDVHAALAHLKAADAKLAKMIERVGPFAMRRDQLSTLFLALGEAIVFQQLNGRAAATIWGRVKALFPHEPEGPSAASLLAMSDEKLRGAGLSANKLLSLRDLARRTQAGELPSVSEAEAMSDEALIERLTAVRGIGRWTVEMLLMFRLGRPDILAVDDFGIRKGFAVTLGQRTMPERAAVAKHGKRWAPYRSVASWYLWRAAALADAKLSDKPAKAAKKKASAKKTKATKKAKAANASAPTSIKPNARRPSAPARARSRAARA